MVASLTMTAPDRTFRAREGRTALIVAPGCSCWRRYAAWMPPGDHVQCRGLFPDMRAPGRACRVSCQVPGRGSGQAEQAQQRLPVHGRAAAEGDRGVRAGGDGRQRVAQRRARGLRERRVTACGEAPEDDHCCQAPRRRATPTTRISGNDTTSGRKTSGNAVTGTGPSALTVSSRTKPGTGRPPGTGTLTTNDAGPALLAHKEWRRTDLAGTWGWRLKLCHGYLAEPPGHRIAGDFSASFIARVDPAIMPEQASP